MAILTCATCNAALPAGAEESALFPFCSPRCKTIDLAKWFKGEHAVVENLDWLPATGLDPETAAELLGVKPPTPRTGNSE